LEAFLGGPELDSYGTASSHNHHWRCELFGVLEHALPKFRVLKRHKARLSKCFWPTGQFTKRRQLADHFQQYEDVWNNIFTRFKTKQDKISERVIEIITH